jgi:hypothetical protein
MSEQTLAARNPQRRRRGRRLFTFNFGIARQDREGSRASPEGDRDPHAKIAHLKGIHNMRFIVAIAVAGTAALMIAGFLDGADLNRTSHCMRIAGLFMLQGTCRP